MAGAEETFFPNIWNLKDPIFEHHTMTPANGDDNDNDKDDNDDKILYSNTTSVPFKLFNCFVNWLHKVGFNCNQWIAPTHLSL